MKVKDFDESKFQHFIVNQKPVPHSPDHWQAEPLMAEKVVLPKVYDPRKKLFPIRNQGQRGTCAAFSAAELKESQEIVDSKITEYLSPEFVYDQRKEVNIPGSEGMDNLDVMKILQNSGICFEKTYPYNPNKEPDDIPQEAFYEAKKFVIKNYARVNTIEACKYAIYKNGSVIIASPVYNFGGRFWKQRPGESLQGGHDTTLCGWNEKGFILRNHWGDDWCDGGYTLFPYEDWGLQYEVYTAVDETFGTSQPLVEKTKTWLRNHLKVISFILVGLGVLVYLYSQFGKL